MGFNKNDIASFLNHFEANKQAIRHFDGCSFLELYRDLNNPSVFFTYSYWEDENALEQYRQSELFKTVWTKTKPLFNVRPEAWSVHKVTSLK